MYNISQSNSDLCGCIPINIKHVPITTYPVPFQLYIRGVLRKVLRLDAERRHLTISTDCACDGQN